MGKGMKTHKATAKRIKVTGKGKFMHSKTSKRHLLTNKGRTTKDDTFGKEVAKVDAPRVKALIPFKLR